MEVKEEVVKVPVEPPKNEEEPENPENESSEEPPKTE